MDVQEGVSIGVREDEEKKKSGQRYPGVGLSRGSARFTVEDTCFTESR
jgi:hypothetical protein